MVRLTGSAILVVAALAQPAQAEEQYCTGEGQPLPEAQVLGILQQQGYQKIRGLEMEHGCYEAKGFDRDGRRVEIYVEPGTGQIVKIKS